MSVGPYVCIKLKISVTAENKPSKSLFANAILSNDIFISFILGSTLQVIYLLVMWWFRLFAWRVEHPQPPKKENNYLFFVNKINKRGGGTPKAYVKKTLLLFFYNNSIRESDFSIALEANRW